MDTIDSSNLPERIMPWKEYDEEDQRAQFFAEASLPDANISEVCRKFGISRTLGYKILNRVKKEGISGLTPRSRRPSKCPNEISSDTVCEIVKERTDHPKWGGAKIRKLLQKNHPKEKAPSVRSIERVLHKAGLITPRRKKSKKSIPDGKLIAAKRPNDVWTVDFKGQWRMKNGKYCYPLTIRDSYSRFILNISAHKGIGMAEVKTKFEECFENYGLPNYIRSDNGNPFACIKSIRGLSSLSAWWIKNGVYHERIPLGKPYLNGSHERMHLDMTKELECNPLENLIAEDERFKIWMKEYNEVRPNQALDYEVPYNVYRNSERSYSPNIDKFKYPEDMIVRKVNPSGLIKWKQRDVYISRALCGDYIGIKAIENNMMTVWFCDILLGITDHMFENSLKE